MIHDDENVVQDIPQEDEEEDLDDDEVEDEDEDDDQDDDSSQEDSKPGYRGKALSTARRGSRKKKSTSRKLWQQSVSISTR